MNGSTNQISEESKEIKSYSPPKKTTHISKKIEKRESQTTKIKKKEIQTLNLEEEEALILDTFAEQDKEKIVKPKKKEPSISPAARKMAAEAKVDLSKVHGSGKHGVILKEDIMNLMGAKPAPSERKITYGPEERIKMTRLRATIAKSSK